MSVNSSLAAGAISALVFGQEPLAEQTPGIPAWTPSLLRLLRCAGLEPLVPDPAESAAESSIESRAERVGTWMAAQPLVPRLIVSELPLPNLELGSAMAARLHIPHVIIEPVAPAVDRQVAWPDARVLRPILRQATAAVSFGHTLPGPLRELAARGRPIIRLRPAIETDGLVVAWRQRDQVRAGLAGRLGLMTDTPWLVTVADMTPGPALESYRLLARALSRLINQDWMLVVSGNGPARAGLSRGMI